MLGKHKTWCKPKGGKAFSIVYHYRASIATKRASLQESSNEVIFFCIFRDQVRAFTAERDGGEIECPGAADRLWR